MKPKEIQTIEEVIEALEHIIVKAKIHRDPIGYFPALYQKVTVKVKEGIETGFFEDGPRMENLDIVFAKRYLDAYQKYQDRDVTTSVWESAFLLTKDYWPITLQHLLMGMNAHISLDLGVAAAEISTPQNIQRLSTDFKRINEVLADLVEEVQKDLAKIWPSWHWILRRTGQIDNHLIDFSMELARNGAWQFANELVHLPLADREACIAVRDSKVMNIARLITRPGRLLQLVLRLMRLGERGDVAAKIMALQAR